MHHSPQGIWALEARPAALRTREVHRCTHGLHNLGWPWARGCHEICRCCWHLRRAIPRLGVHVGIIAWPAATMSNIGRTLPTTSATTTTTTTTMPTMATL